jgi:hypothetical protein
MFDPQVQPQHPSRAAGGSRRSTGCAGGARVRSTCISPLSFGAIARRGKYPSRSNRSTHVASAGTRIVSGLRPRRWPPLYTVTLVGDVTIRKTRDGIGPLPGIAVACRGCRGSGASMNATARASTVTASGRARGSLESRGPRCSGARSAAGDTAIDGGAPHATASAQAAGSRARTERIPPSRSVS